jgi:hypothetical protein
VSKRVKIGIDSEHAKKLLAGKQIAITIPQGAQVLELSFSFPIKAEGPLDGIAKLVDVFFNGRSA